MSACKPDEELCSAGNIIAGPFHPAFGELVQSHLLYQDLTPKLQALLDAGADQIRFSCPVQRQSQLRGLKNSNLQLWQQLAAPVRSVSWLLPKQILSLSAEV